MSGDRQNEVPSQAASADCPLSAREQTRNLLLYGINVGLLYLGAPVVYVGLAQASLCEKLGASATVSNLPSTIYFWMTPLPIVVAWYFCAVRHLKPVLVAGYLLAGLGGAAVMATLLLPTPEGLRQALLDWNSTVPADFQSPIDWVIPAMMLHAAVLGGVLQVVATYQWEMIGRGVSEARRGQALGLAFGVGPILAFASSIGSQQVIGRIAYPWSFAVLFGITAPLMAIAAFLSTRFVVPPPTVDATRPPFVKGVFGGLSDFLSYRVILLASIAMVLVTAGYNIFNNISLFSKIAMGKPAGEIVGDQNTLRFGFKIAGGLVLGWLLTRTHPKSGMLVTAGFCAASALWAMCVPGQWFLISFGLMGVGELFGVYYPNYILSCSSKTMMRRNMAFTSMLNMPASLAPVVYGSIVDRVGKAYDPKLGYQVSFAAALAILGVTLCLVYFALPNRPRPREESVLETPKATEKDALPAGT